MAVGLSEPDKIFPVAGIKLASVAAGIKKNGNNDLVVFLFDEDATCAATFTQNAFCAAPVTLAKKHLSLLQNSHQQPRALLINSGNANAYIYQLNRFYHSPQALSVSNCLCQPCS